jgi:hypothetical protein
MKESQNAAPATETYADHFSGAVPPLAYFHIRLNDLDELSTKFLSEFGSDFASELCIVGLAAYFEAFCKDHFAALVNILPEILGPFSEVRVCKIPVKSLLHALPDPTPKLGFLIAEEYDFGSAKAINGLFGDLLKVSPFSKDDMAKYSEFLADRNLLVHHGGVYTLKYAVQKKLQSHEMKSKVNFVSLTVGPPDVKKWATFLREIAVKLAHASAVKLSEFATNKNISLSEEQDIAIQALEYEL